MPENIPQNANGQAPVQPIAAAPVQPQPQAQPVVNQPIQRPGQPVQRPVANRQPPNPKKVVYGCLGCFSVMLILFVLFVLVFVAQTSSNGINPLAKALNVDTGTFINNIILLVNFVFGSVFILLFLLAIIGLFRLAMARKDDAPAKKSALSMTGVSALLLILITMIWVGVYLFLNSRRVPVQKNVVNSIVTDPASTLNLTAPVLVKFDASNLPISTSRYSIEKYDWNFGDGNTSSAAITSNTYKDMGKNGGRFDVTLAVTVKDKQSGAETTNNYTALVTIANVAINAQFTATPTSGPAPLTVSFDGSASTAPAGQITAYDWDFNNSNLFKDASGAKASYTFNQSGTYTVALRVTDNTNQYQISTQQITVNGANAPTSVISIPSPSGKYFSGTQYSFDGSQSSSPNGKIVSYEWDFGDGTPHANTRVANHTYKDTGKFEVSLKTTDDSGVSGTATQELKVELPSLAPIAAMTTVPAKAKDQDYISGTVPFQVSFDASKSQKGNASIVDYKWDFDGDGVIDDTGVTTSYVYNKEGTYNAKLTVVDADNNESSQVVVVKVGAQPLTADLKASVYEGTSPLTVTFDASGSSYPNGTIVSYEWDFGDGSPKRIDVSKVTYKYLKIGTFTAKVTTVASDGSKSTAQVDINVRPISLTACYTATPTQGPSPLTVDFNPMCSTGTVARYSWDFGDGQTSKTRNPSHTFNSPGSYKVTLEVTDNDNVLNDYSSDILVTGTVSN